MARQYPYIWDYDLSEEEFRSILSGETAKGRLDRDWAAVRLLEYAPYAEIIHLLGFRALVDGWPGWRHRIRAENRIRGFDFLTEWLPKNHPELL